MKVMKTIYRAEQIALIVSALVQVAGLGTAVTWHTWLLRGMGYTDVNSPMVVLADTRSCVPMSVLSTNAALRH